MCKTCNLLEKELHTVILNAMDPSHGATLLHATKLHRVTVPLGGINVDSNRLEYKFCSY